MKVYSAARQFNVSVSLTRSFNHFGVVNAVVGARVIHEAGHRPQLFGADGACDEEGFVCLIPLHGRINILQVQLCITGFVLTSP